MAPPQDLTGNDYASIPFVGDDGSLDGINVLHGRMAGLVEWAGAGPDEPLLLPRIYIDDELVPMTDARWRRLDRWIPTFSLTTAAGDVVSGVVCAPGGLPAARGFLLRIEVENRGRAPKTVRVELDVRWRWSRLRIATARPLPGSNRLSVNDDGTALVLEADGGRGPALALCGSLAVSLHAPGAAIGDGARALPAGAVVEAENGTPVAATITQTAAVPSRQRAALSFFGGAGPERDGALAASRSLRRGGADHGLHQARLDLSQTLRSGQDHRWAELLNRNLVFNRYFATGRGIDDDRLYLLRSRSPACAAPALFNEREAIFWTVPALIIADPAVGREAILRVLESFSERSGEHTRYIDGGAFDPGFALEQFLLYPWIIDHYVAATGDTTLTDEPLVRQILLETDSAAFARLHPQYVLGSSDVLPSGEPADYPFTTMGNVLLHAFCLALPRLPWPDPPEPPPRLDGAAGEVAAAIWQHCVTDVNGQTVLASSASLDGQAAVYDDPAMSLALAPFFGFCAVDDPVWSDTMDYLRSRRYPLWRDGVVPGLAGRSQPAQAEVAALCADLLGHEPQPALDRLLRISLPAGVAAAAYDPSTGAALHPHHAALAGFLAWALVKAAEPAVPRTTSKKRRR
ncbi:MAG: hypothetical protein WD054_00185 [Gemmatimonadota bacterium]